MSTGSLSGRNRAHSQAAIRKRSPKELAKSSTTTSFRPKFERLLQEGKIEHIMNTDPHTKANLFYTTHINELEKELASTKKSLSTMVMKSKSKQYNINKLKNEIAKIERDQAALTGQSEFNKTKLNDAKDKLDKKKDQVEDKFWVDKCYRHLKFRLDHDVDFLRARHDQRQNAVNQLKNEKKILEGQYQDLCQFQRKLEYNFQRAKEISKEQTDDKNQFIELLNMEMAEKDMLNDLKIAKNQRQQHINDLATSVIEKQELQKYLQILFTHKVVSQILKNKSQKLIDRYSLVQNAFLHIRSNTNITQMSKVLERMENQDKQYESLLTKVNILEKQLLGMDDKMGQVVKKQHQILSKGGDKDLGKQDHHYQGIEKDNYEILVLQKEKLKDRKNQDQILKQKILLWAKQHCSLFGLDYKASNDEQFFQNLKALAATIQNKIK